ncbi:MAG: hypothetical protein A2600_09900 [Candidatus Lambdaproteobacteria bacterium RIFOXYD1_FULL_56_27]|uniref:Secreted protein n=1 Tax=Candidatus Lambdaproteobacteria bacterium RIFOXYD2_FULL_56_26 TaxID=1817773 RepID=A0A1F6GUG6_9PROT|nr:MAG: hypothetical protein A2557_11790 [Candidatus Lambdaproteobacteria bacterium RIFOXYD2_FULL_56_26]OGH04330.1 MAG: hypothetical protein A2426_05755 [Candidatus Lambdaproteobacteria bacterium RIFOXYC1_FULL_56_13]OGH07392.1 MAG: hypothetical protein A2600_09900 [Candidatus Lambdaproteobacteria bacterium RIFOXYD1_FULL_56_27]
MKKTHLTLALFLAVPGLLVSAPELDWRQTNSGPFQELFLQLEGRQFVLGRYQTVPKPDEWESSHSSGKPRAEKPVYPIPQGDNHERDDETQNPVLP